MIQSTLPFISKEFQHHIPIHLVRDDDFADWRDDQSPSVQAQIKHVSESPKPEKSFVIVDEHGEISFIITVIHTPVSIYDLPGTVRTIQDLFDDSVFETTSFGLIPASGLTHVELEHAYIGWVLGCYKFSAYKQKTTASPQLVMNETPPRIPAFSEALILVKDLINTPANDMGPDELAQAVRAVAKRHKAKVKIIKDKDLLKENFPLIYTVGKASPRHPRLIELNWGKDDHPKVTLVGKGVCFDTGGLNLKPTPYMAHMKKDMGGAAHTLALAHLIMAVGLPVRLQLLIPAVENSVAGESFRPGDILQSRKGLYVENTNTDAEGRLILADTLTYACEGNPALIIDYATLTGSARAGLGPDIPALFSNNDEVAQDIRVCSFAKNDPVWPMPLWEPYKKHIEKSSGDVLNSAGLPGDLIYSALFLQTFLDTDCDSDWVHLDCYAWEHSGRDGRPVGGADTGLRAVFAYLEKRFGTPSQQ